MSKFHVIGTGACGFLRINYILRDFIPRIISFPRILAVVVKFALAFSKRLERALFKARTSPTSNTGINMSKILDTKIFRKDDGRDLNISSLSWRNANHNNHNMQLNWFVVDI